MQRELVLLVSLVVVALTSKTTTLADQVTANSLDGQSDVWCGVYQSPQVEDTLLTLHSKLSFLDGNGYDLTNQDDSFGNQVVYEVFYTSLSAIAADCVNIRATGESCHVKVVYDDKTVLDKPSAVDITQSNNICFDSERSSAPLHVLVNRDDDWKEDGFFLDISFSPLSSPDAWTNDLTSVITMGFLSVSASDCCDNAASQCIVEETLSSQVLENANSGRADNDSPVISASTMGFILGVAGAFMVGVGAAYWLTASRKKSLALVRTLQQNQAGMVFSKPYEVGSPKQEQRSTSNQGGLDDAQGGVPRQSSSSSDSVNISSSGTSTTRPGNTIVDHQNQKQRQVFQSIPDGEPTTGTFAPPDTLEFTDEGEHGSPVAFRPMKSIKSSDRLTRNLSSGSQQFWIDKFEPGPILGQGAQGTACVATRRSDGLMGVLKTSRLEADVDEEQLRAVSNEAKFLQRMEHPNIVRYFEFFIEDYTACIFMEYAKGGTLGDLISQKKLLNNTPLVRTIAIGIVEGIKHVHRNSIIHRDMKPTNVFMDEALRPKIGDFGISRELSGTSSYANTMVGTPYYICPEICNGHSYGQEADIWSFGCILYEMLCGERPFKDTSIMLIVKNIVEGNYPPLPPTVPPAMRTAVERCLQVNPRNRVNCDGLLALLHGKPVGDTNV